MDQVKCTTAGCNERSTLHFIRVERRRPVEIIDLCPIHANAHFTDHHDRYYSMLRRGAGRPISLENAIALDLDIYFWDELRDPAPWGQCRVELLEIGGTRRFGFPISLFDWTALDHKIKGHQFPRPLTHDTMMVAMLALGGELQHVEIDKFNFTASVYEAKLHIRQRDKGLVIDCRTSDAIVLAMICNAPIFISENLLEREKTSGTNS